MLDLLHQMTNGDEFSRPSSNDIPFGLEPLRAKPLRRESSSGLTVLMQILCRGWCETIRQRVLPLLCLSLLLCGCLPGARATPAAPATTKTPKPTFTPVSIVVEIPTPGPSPPSAPGPAAEQCPLTGEELSDPSLAARRPIAVKIEASTVSGPQSGLSRADMVFEHLTEGGITRFTALYLCRDSVALGPIRSARLIDLEIVPMFDALFAHVGACQPIMELIAKSDIADFDEYLGTPGYHRIPERKAPYNVYTSTDALWGVASERGWQRAVELEELPFSEEPPAAEATAIHISIPYSRWFTIEYQHDPQRRAYLRAMSGEPCIEAITGEQLTVTNVIVLYAIHNETNIRDALGARTVEIELTGQGRAIIFRDGLAFEARWLREERDQMLRYVDAFGNPIPLRPGNTWVQVVPHDMEIEWR